MAGRSMSLDVLVRLRDLMSGPLRRLRDNLRQLGSFARQIGILGAAIGAISFMGPIREAAAFQQQLIDMAAVTGRANQAAFDFAATTGRQFEDLALRVGLFSDTIAKGANEMLAAGLNEKLVDATIGSISEATKATNSQFDDMAAVAIASLKTLKLPADQLRDALGAIVVSGKEGAFEVRDMAKVFPQLTSQVAKFGVTGRDAINFLAPALQIARMGTSDPATAANNLNNFLSKALAPVTQKNFKDMGVDIQAVMMDAATKGINPIEAMIQKIGSLTGVSSKQIGKYMDQAKAKGLQDVDALAYVREQLEKIGAAGKIGELFQDQQVLDFLIPMLANIDEYKRIKQLVAEATGAVIDDDLATQQKTINHELIRFQEIGTQASREVGAAFALNMPTVNSHLEAALKWFRTFDAESGGWGKTLLSWTGTALIGATALGLLGLVLPIVGAGIGMVGAAAALMLSPIGLLIGALAAGGAYIYKNWDQFGPRLKRLWESTKSAFRSLSDRVVSLGRRMIDGARELWREYGPAIRTALEGAWARAVGLAEHYGPIVRRAFEDAFNGSMKEIEKFKTGFTSRSGEIGSAWSDLKEQLQTTGASIQTLLSDFWTDLDFGVPGGFNAEAMGKLIAGEMAAVLKDLKTLLEEIKAIIEFIRQARNEGLEQAIEDTPFGKWWQDMKDEGNKLLGFDKGEVPAQKLTTWLKGLFGGGTSAGADAAKPAGKGDRVPGPVPERFGPPVPELPSLDLWRALQAIGQKLLQEPLTTPKGDRLGPRTERFGDPLPKPAVDVSGNINVSIKVDGPGKLTGMSSDNDRIRVGSNGRMVGSV